eukprot:scaffold185573_cov17-Prasinocladus_malaysianus.AAC.1
MIIGSLVALDQTESNRIKPTCRCKQQLNTRCYIINKLAIPRFCNYHGSLRAPTLILPQCVRSAVPP